jgi:hypothetical protein
MVFLDRLQAYLSGNRTRVISRSVSCDARVVVRHDILDGGEAQDQLCWDEVDAAFAYKKDCFAVDLIMIALCDGDGNVRVHVSEEDVGYEILIRELPQRIVGFPQPEEWFPGVAFPAFETNWTELYRRPRRA